MDSVHSAHAGGVGGDHRTGPIAGRQLGELSPVTVHQRRAGFVLGEGMAFSPLPQGDDGGEQVLPGAGQLVDVALATRGGAGAEDAVLDESAESVGEDVARDAELLPELGERGRSAPDCSRSSCR